MSGIQLSDEQKQTLIQLAASAPELIIHRARLILAYAAGKPTLQAAREAGISRGRARYWKRQFFARGMGIFDLDNSASKAVEGTQLGEDSTVQADLSENAPRNALNTSPDSKIEITFPQPFASIGIKIEDSLATAGKKVWLFNFALMLNHEGGTLLGKDNEELHDMRVATRRMRTAFDVFGPAFDPKIMKRFLKGLRAIGRTLGGVRDMDVIVEHALNYRAEIEENARFGLDPLINSWKHLMDKKRSKMVRHLQSEEYHIFKESFNIFLQAPDHDEVVGENMVMNPQLRDVVPVLVYGRYAAVRTYETILPTASIPQLHALRIEFKKFRYVLEYFREILGDKIGQAISEIKRIQDHLGELHDIDVACQLVGDFLADWEQSQLRMPIADRQNPEPIVTYLASLYAERYRLVSTFPVLWTKFSRPEFRQGIAQAISQL
jgi:CHAD domain-containing protein